MIERYQRDAMKAHFTDHTKFTHFLDVELAVCEALYKTGEIPKADYDAINSTSTNFNLEEIDALEKDTKHDVMAFVMSVRNSIQSDAKRFFHYGLTSNDVVDTAFALTIKKANRLLANTIEALLETLKEKALKYKDLPCLGRTHGIHAEPMSFGLKFALWYDRLNTNYRRFISASKDLEVVKLGGAVGNFAHLSPSIETMVAERLNLGVPSITTQVLPRDNHQHYHNALVLIANVLEQIATEIRSLQRSEIGEVSEGFSKNQKGSSAMPHKKNPIGSENITGCARLMRGYQTSIAQNVALWHERDISHSSVERVAMVDSIILCDYMTARMNTILENLVVHEDAIQNNLTRFKHQWISQRLMLTLIRQGYDRIDVYDTIKNLEPSEVPKVLKTHYKMDDDTINTLYDSQYYLKNTHALYKKIGILD